ncbi:hypothetical protein P43SY_007557 [Pythium insidiosum]|uniref:VWFA domain-containing protein n=1 Tax=Pythium insidiosum TaxID=114742 RepID=A0AAD5LUC3_PYTIN|nr:hypothetical protein P43SY_007557 [Pythium insidiosum]
MFYGASRGVDKARFTALLDASMAEDALHTLKLVAYIRDCRGGKGERELGRWALERLAQTHPRALAHNLAHYVGDFGRFDDPAALMGTPVESTTLEFLKSQLEADLAVLKQESPVDETPNEPESEDAAAAAAADQKKASLVSISLCAKWIPSENKALDKRLKMNKKLAQHMGLTPATLRKQYLSPLRERLRILERFMCANEWEAINLSAVPSVAMRIHGKPGKAFERHLPDKFNDWRSKLKSGETKVNAKVLFPHEVVAEYLTRNRELDELLEAQWQVILDGASAYGDLSKTLVLSDVSGSMHGRPMEVSIALGLLVSSVASDAYKDLVLTFESSPQFHHIQGDTLKERVRSLANAPWGGSTDFAAAFRAVLRLAKEAKLTREQMPERLIVISDMQFNCADSNYETNYQVLARSFEEAGYEVPHMVFWNVNGSTSDCPVYNGQARVSLVSGFSTAILKSVLRGVEITPLQTVLNVVLDERYDAITLPPEEPQTAEKPEDSVLADAVLL